MMRTCILPQAWRHSTIARVEARQIALDEGLTELARLDARQAQIVEIHFFGGLTYEEIAELLNIGRSTVIRDLRMAEAWLKNYVFQ